MSSIDEWDDFDVPEEKAPETAGVLKELVGFGEELVDKLDTIADLEAEIASLKHRTKEISEKILPTMLEDIGVSSLTLKDGRTIGLKDDIYVTTSGKYRQIVCDWLREVGRDGAVRRVVSVEFGKGETSSAEDLAKSLDEQGFKALYADSIHPGTFKALLKEMMQEGVTVPLEALGGYQRTHATLVK